MNRRRVAVVALVAVLFSMVLPVSGMAAENMTLTQAIQRAKELLPDLQYPSQFESSLSEIDGRPVWHLRWYSKEEPTHYVNLSLDASSGQLLDFRQYRDPGQETYAPIPEYSQEQAYPIAEAFAKHVAGAQLAQCKYQPVPPPRPFLSSRHWPQFYHFTFKRFVNDIPFNMNTISVSVHGDTGEVESFSMRWHDLEFPEPTNLIGTEKAAEVLKQQGDMKLMYLWPSSVKPEEARPFLAYSFPKANSLYINAQTGELVSEYYPYPHEAPAGYGEKQAREDTALTPEEAAVVTKIDGLLTLEQVEAKAREEFNIPSEIPLQSRRLVKDWQFRSVRVWTLSFYAKDVEDGYISYNASFDAKTGELLSYNHDQDYKAPEQGSMTFEQAEAFARAFIEQQSPDKVGQVKLVTEPTERKEGDKLPVYYYFRYEREFNGIPFPANYVTVSVKADEKPEVMHYSLRWVETHFPSPAKALELDAAYTQVVERFPFILEYRLVTEEKVTKVSEKSSLKVLEPKIVLAYRLTSLPSYVLSPTDLHPIDYQGKPVVEKEETLPQDVAGHWAEGDIMFLGKVGIIEAPHGQFKPDQDITVGEWIEMLSRATGWHTDHPIIVLPPWAKAAEGQPYAGLVRTAINVGLILPGENVDLSKALTREDLAVFAVRAMGYEKVASLPGIYQLPVTDAAQVSPERVGHVAITIGLKVMVGSSNTFRPQNVTSKAEAAVVLVRLLNVER